MDIDVGKGVIKFLKQAGLPLAYFVLCGVGCFFLWKIRDRQPGNTRYSVAIYAGIGGCIALIFLGFWIFGFFD